MINAFKLAGREHGKATSEVGGRVFQEGRSPTMKQQPPPP